MGELTGKVAVITGAAQGIGFTFAKALAAEGVKVVIADISDPSNAVAEIKAAGGEALGIVTDITDNDSLENMVKKTEAAFGHVNILINNAAFFGTLKLNSFWDIEEGEWDLVMKVNVRGPFQTTKALLPSLRKSGEAKILNIGSGTTFRGAPMFMHYVTSKGAVMTMTRSMARELGPDNINVNQIAIGFTASPNVLTNEDYMTNFVKPTLASRIFQRDMIPEDIIGAMLFLTSSASNFMTGQTINVDGGAVMH